MNYILSFFGVLFPNVVRDLFLNKFDVFSMTLFNDFYDECGHIKSSKK